MATSGTQVSPYAPYAEGRLLAMPPGAELPKRCVFCGEEGRDPQVVFTVTNDSYLKRMGSTNGLAAAGGLAGGAIGGLIAGAITGAFSSGTKGKTKFWKIPAYLCDHHRKSHKRFARLMIICALVLLIALVVVGWQMGVPWAMLGLFFALILLAIIASLFQKRLVFKREEYGTLYIKGTSRKFLKTLAG